MNIVDFLKESPTEKECKEKFKSIRESKGVTCKKCSHTEHYWKKDKEEFECKKCRFRTTLRSGTMMQGSKLSFQYWFIAMHLLTSTKKVFHPKKYKCN